MRILLLDHRTKTNCTCLEINTATVEDVVVWYGSSHDTIQFIKKREFFKHFEVLGFVEAR